MNPSHFPQVLRSRSRSPSPVSHNRGCDQTTGAEWIDSWDEPRVNSNCNEENLLSVPAQRRNKGNLVRSVSSADGQVSQIISHPCAVNAELENMASVEIISACHSINDGSRHHQVSESDQSSSDADPGKIFTTQHKVPHLRSANGRVSRGRERCPESHDHSSGTENNYGSCTPDQVDQVRRRVKFFFMDPCSKFKARRHIPWKMSLQILKIIIITIQLVQFGGQRSEIVEFFERNQKTLEHLLLKNWDASFETMPYPPATGAYALYTVDDLLNYIEHAWKQYHNLSDNSLATIDLLKINGTDRVVSMSLCYRFNNYDDITNGSTVVGPGVLSNCTDLDPVAGANPYSIRTFLRQKNLIIPFTKLLDLTLKFPFRTFHLNLLEKQTGPTCYRVDAKILFKNYAQSGQILISLSTSNTERECSGRIMSQTAKDDEQKVRTRSVLIDSAVIVICSMSTMLCLRSLWRAWKLRQTVEELFKKRFGKALHFADRMEFVNLWYALIIANDICTISGAALKIRLELRTVTITSFNYDLCSLLLGLGCLMAWIGCLRYLGFFKKYNILILTLKTAFPSMLRFMVCALSIYFGFMFSGWVILGPYHIKFRQLSSASECLYSLVNGDDMFVTFSATVTDNVWVWYFSRIYLYVFISLFIYCVLSLFISVIMDTYETLKECYDKGFPKTDLQKFIEQCNDPLHSGLYRRQHTENDVSDFSFIECFTSCCHRRSPSKETNESSHLLTRTI